ncbi:P-loop containing nucleoside triphosphate hydrolase protein [Cylindrobasidium torrendii FP15055 ss-10]|uniref:p-loop containing nucleoside triphosphate hydrolase protein n=1 Tax=Cylindrobasidium torrendii FP15055 ss-10 TaxID=1314674 RepID=A0A0D7B8L8_9AGAR|nr:P-loop containing nucleoside triphosphate hydrolase protein [Cylindrobasidium torrendii FP15055 ss-10]
MASSNDIAISRMDLGVWHVAYVKDVGILRFFQSIPRAVKGVPTLARFFGDIYRINRGLTAAYVFSQIFKGLSPAIKAYFEHKLIREVEKALVTRQAGSWGIVHAVVSRVLCFVALSAVETFVSYIVPRLRIGIRRHFQLMILKAQMSMDLKAAQDPQNAVQVNGSDAWYSFVEVTDFALTDITTLVSNFALILQSTRSSTANHRLMTLCIARSIFSLLSTSRYWKYPHIYYSRNQAYLRLCALERMTEEPAQLIQNGLGPYVVEEFDKAQTALTGICDDGPRGQENDRPRLFENISNSLLADIPMLYSAYLALNEPWSLSIAQFAVMQRSAASFSESIEEILSTVDTFQTRLQQIDEIYKVGTIVGGMADGERPYPDEEHEKSVGMSIEARNLCFSYPSDATINPTLENVSFSIQAGQVVVIVGANGSGKSTLINLLTRAYDPSSGPESLLVDGHPMSDYRLDDLRKATAILSQDHEIYPLSVRENVGLGYVEKCHDVELIQRAIDLGGARHYVEKLQDGLEAQLDYYDESSCMDLSDDEHPLRVELTSLPSGASHSGGEKQRIVAARTFMKFMSGRTKLVAVDEPTSALDPEGEQMLFENLLRTREGKTMVFVTHRFGPLTREADLIMCMKDGKLLESGRHTELMALNGEYAKLYNMQASAFIEPAQHDDSDSSEE